MRWSFAEPAFSGPCLRPCSGCRIARIRNLGGPCLFTRHEIGLLFHVWIPKLPGRVPKLPGRIPKSEPRDSFAFLRFGNPGPGPETPDSGPETTGPDSEKKRTVRQFRIFEGPEIPGPENPKTNQQKRTVCQSS